MKTLSTLHYPLQRRGKGRNKKPFQLEWPIQIRPPGLRFENPSIPSLLPFKMQHPSEPEREKGKKWRRRKERHFTGACMGKRGGRVGVRRERGGKGALQRGGGGGEKFANSAQETHLRSQRAGEGEKGEALESSSKREAGGRDRDGYKCSFPSSLHWRSGGEVGEAHASNDEEERREGGGTGERKRKGAFQFAPCHFPERRRRKMKGGQKFSPPPPSSSPGSKSIREKEEREKGKKSGVRWEEGVSLPAYSFTLSHLLYKRGLLLRGAVLEELLDDVVAKDVRHQTVRGGHDFVKHSLLLLREKIQKQHLVSPKLQIKNTTKSLTRGVARSSFCCMNLDPCWSWENSTTWPERSRSWMFGKRLFLENEKQIGKKEAKKWRFQISSGVVFCSRVSRSVKLFNARRRGKGRERRLHGQKNLSSLACLKSWAVEGKGNLSQKLLRETGRSVGLRFTFTKRHWRWPWVTNKPRNDSAAKIPYLSSSV